MAKFKVGDWVDIHFPADPSKPGKIVEVFNGAVFPEIRYAVAWSPPYEFNSGATWKENELRLYLNGLEEMLRVSFGDF